MRGIITLRDIKVMCILGVYAHERTEPQLIIMNVKFELSLPKEDRLSATLNYEHVSSLCSQIAQEGKFLLLESLAKELYFTLRERLCLSKVWVSVCKLNVPEHTQSVSCEVGEWLGSL